ncbi:MAG: type II secretion system F family protein [Fimbriimonadales bacterium]|jgi:type IV pilus assembly protein PilC|nr:type II secretion system F family protein [Fimbriimonadales bacterium]
MPYYECRVRSAQSEPKTLQIEAPSLQAALEQLHRDGYFVVQVREKRTRARTDTPSWLQRFQQVKLEDLVAFSREFAVMIRAGVPIMESLQSIIQHMRPGLLRTALEQVQRDVEGGTSLSEAMGKHPLVFPDLYVSLIRAAEASGSLDTVLKRAADYLNESLGLARRVKSALMYPAVVLVATLFVMAYMVAFIVPKFAEMFQQMAVNLPLTTKLLVALGEVGAKNKVLVMLSPILILGTLWGLWRVRKIRERLSYWVARLPLVGDLTLKVILTRVLSALQTLISTGVSLPRALELAAETAGDHRMETALHQVRAQVETGIPLAQALKDTGIFPSLVIQLVAAGEKTGALPEMLGEITAFYEDEVQQKLKGLTSTLEPMMMLFLGLVIGVFAFSVISPIYDLMDKMK